MKRLFVDCDDTLIIYDDTYQEANPFGYLHGIPYTRNYNLIRFIREFRRKYPEGFIVIWTGGGQDYAYQVTQMVGLDDVTPWYMVKDKTTFYLVRPGDIVIDDQDINVPTEVWRPDDERIKNVKQR